MVLTLKSTCNTFGVKNGVGRAFERRSISIWNEMTKFSSKFERLRFAICSDCFDTEIDMQCVSRVEWSGKSFYMPQYLNQERNNRVFVEI
jgi:hypothetical protein